MRIYYIQPLIACYRVPILNTLRSKHDVTVVANVSQEVHRDGFKNETIETVRTYHAPVSRFFNGRIAIQKTVTNLSLKNIDAVLSFADPRYISYWILLLRCLLKRKRFYSHGQGLYAHPNPGFIRRYIYRAMVNLSTKYICYTEISRQSLLAIGCHDHKLAVAENSLQLESVVPPDEKQSDETGILFLGRLRDGCRLELLVTAIKQMRESGKNVVLHVIGGGVLEKKYRADFVYYNWIIWHGPIHDDKHIAQISRECRLGCYPGDAGLSVVHMFGLSLPPVIHSSICEHMGPEPSYVNDNKNGFLFNKNGGVEALVACLNQVWMLSDSELKKVKFSAFESYVKLNEPPLGIRFQKIIES